MAGSGIAGPALAGGLVATVGSGWALAADAATFAVSAVFLASLRLPAHERLPAQPFVQDLLDGWREFRARTWVWVFVLYASLANMMLAPFIVLGATIAKRSLGGPGAWALILAAFGLGSFVGGLVVLRIRPRRPLFVAALTVSFVAFPSLLLASGASAEAVAVASFLAGGGLMLANVLWETTLQQHVPPASLSRVSAYDWFGSLAFRPVGYALVGPVSLRLGTEGTLWLAAGWLLVSGAAVLAVPSVRRVEARIDPQSRAPAETLGSPRESFDPER